MEYFRKFGLIAGTAVGLSIGIIPGLPLTSALAQESSGQAAQQSSTAAAQSAPAATSQTQQSPPATPAPTSQNSAQKDQAAPSTITVHSGKMDDIGKKDEPAQYDAQHPMPKLSKEPITKETRMMVMRSLNAETVFARKALPLGQRGVILKDGRLSPPDRQLAMLVATYGPAVKPGDRAMITDVKILDKSIIFELNGGPKKKKKWYQHIEVGGMGGSVPVAAQDPNEANAKGTTVELAFDRFVPEMTGDQVRDLLAPVLDFHAKSAAEAYIDTVPPKVKQAIKDHHVLVGMNKEMVQYAKGKPANKVREKDDSGKDYEEWIYGAPPEEVQFIRFNGDEVTQVKIMPVDGQKIVKTQKEINIENGTATLAKKVEQTEEEKKAARVPSLKRPGEAADPDAPTAQAARRTPQPASAPKDDEEWGKPKTAPAGTPPDPNAPKTQDPGVPKL
jgi:hypothetical protein